MALVRPVSGPLGRTDMGVDIAPPPGSPVVAIAPSRAIGVIRDWFRGQPYMWFQILSGPFRGRFWYAAEQIRFSVHPGQRVEAGQRIGTIAPSGTGTEFGWATRSGRTLASATTGYTEGEVTPAGKSFRAALGGARTADDQGWKPCTLTWYDPALGGTNSGSGQADPHASTASGEPYNAHAFTCAAPPEYAFGTHITFRYRRRMVTCKVNDRGGAIHGSHFDLSRAAAKRLGVISAGMAHAEFSVVGSGRSTPGMFGRTRPGGEGSDAPPDTDAEMSTLFQGYLDEGAKGDTAFASFQESGRKMQLAGWIPLPGGPGIHIPGLGIPDDPLHVFTDPFKAVKSAVDFLKWISWLFHPRNILRCVEFVVGFSLMAAGLWITMDMYRHASLSSGRRRRAPTTRRITRRVISATPAGRAMRVSQGARAGRRTARAERGQKEFREANQRARTKERAKQKTRRATKNTRKKYGSKPPF